MDVTPPRLRLGRPSAGPLLLLLIAVTAGVLWATSGGPATPSLATKTTMSPSPSGSDATAGVITGAPEPSPTLGPTAGDSVAPSDVSSDATPGGPARPSHGATATATRPSTPRTPTTRPTSRPTAPATATPTGSPDGSLPLIVGSHVTLADPWGFAFAVTDRSGQAWWSVQVTTSSPLGLRTSATWIVRRGLADPGCVSFESALTPGSYLRHRSFVGWVERRDGSGLFDADATWCPGASTDGSDGVSLRSSNYPSLYLTRELDGTLSIKDAASVNAHNQVFHVGHGYV